MYNILLVVLICFASTAITATPNEFDQFLVTRQQLPFKHHELTANEFLKYGILSDVSNLREHIKKLAVPRVVGTTGHTLVREHIVQTLTDLKWSVKLQRFHGDTPVFGTLHFHNIIAKHNENADRFLMLACHYDSKYFENFEFIGATDSAVPCGMLLNLAHVLDKALNELGNKKISVMLVFFDGEEAFKQWNANDSIYGARHMAKVWEDNGFLERIDLLVLLDLIGMPDPKFYSFFAKTETWYSRLLELEHRLANTDLLERYASSGLTQYVNNQYFQPQALRSSYVEDDHIPFLKRDVPVIHLITMPFPDVWHTEADNLTVIDYITTENVARIIRLFTMEYLLGGT